MVKNPAADAGDTGEAGSIPGSGRSPGRGNSNPLQYYWLENSTDRGAWQSAVQSKGSKTAGHDRATEHTHTQVAQFVQTQRASECQGQPGPQVLLIPSAASTWGHYRGTGPCPEVQAWAWARDNSKGRQENRKGRVFLFYWRVIALQCCGGLCHISMQISHNYIYISPPS